MAKEHVIIKNISKIYPDGTKALHDINLVSEEGEIVVLLGSSGCGKSTLLRIIGGLEKKTSGEVFFYDKEISGVPVEKRDIGFVFQFYNLIPNLTALENVELALQICKDPLDAKKVLEDVGLGDRLDNFPAQLSGGEQQRVSIARALAKNPKLLLCDEPTGALDYNTGKAILKLLQNMCRERGMTVIVITHNQALAPMADRLIHIKNGQVSHMETNENPMSIDEIEW